MPRIEVDIFIQAPLERVYAIAKEVEAFPQFMPDITVRVLERSEDGNHTLTEWVGYAPQIRLKVKWTEEDLWDDATHTCRFRQLQGDYEKMEGEWRFVAENGGTRFLSVLEYELNIPLLGPLVQKVVHHQVRQSLQGILEGIKKRAEGETQP